MGLFDAWLGSTTLYKKGYPTVKISRSRQGKRMVQHFEYLVHHPEKEEVLIVYGEIEDGQPVISHVNDLCEDEFKRLEDTLYKIVLEEWHSEYALYSNLEHDVMMDRIAGI